MFQIDSYMDELIVRLKNAFAQRLVYVGLQGSYLRGEATEDSDLDIMCVVDRMETKDLCRYRSIILEMDGYEKSCGFICSREDLKNWNPLEICHLIYTTKDYVGKLGELVPDYSEMDVRNFVRMSVGNLYHEICHRYIHASGTKNISLLPAAFKGVFFILQNLYYLRTGIFAMTKSELMDMLSGNDRKVLEEALRLQCDAEYDFEHSFELLFSWCQETLKGLE